MDKKIHKKKIFNDPVYGFITIPDDFIYSVIEHPWFQRLRRIRQLGLTDYVYPGANHSRFHHALGAMHLMGLAIQSLRNKGHEITDDEALGSHLAILLHDIGHGPFSHALENSIIPGLHHEKLSLWFMQALNEEFSEKLTTAIEIFTDTYPKRFLHQLVSSQLDVDRLDYLKRDSFYTGVAEGTVGSDRIIKMMEVVNDGLVIEEKGLYSIEKFILARRFMYWQVYLHKTVISAENLLVNMLKRARELMMKGENVPTSSCLAYFLNPSSEISDMRSGSPALLSKFSGLDDYDIFASAKEWINHSDKILSDLSKRLINRKLLKIKIQNSPFNPEEIMTLKEKFMSNHLITDSDAEYFVFNGKIENSAYRPFEEKINIFLKSGEVIDIREASEQLRISVLTESTQKYFLCFPQELVTQAS